MMNTKTNEKWIAIGKVVTQNEIYTKGFRRTSR